MGRAAVPEGMYVQQRKVGRLQGLAEIERDTSGAVFQPFPKQSTCGAAEGSWVKHEIAEGT